MTKLETFVIKWLNNNYGDLEIFEMPEHPDYIFHMKNGKCILQHDKKTGCVYVNYEEIWSFLKSIFGMEYQQIQFVTKEWVEEQYKLGVTTTHWRFRFKFNRVEEQYKLGVTTTVDNNNQTTYLVKEKYKLVIKTTEESWIQHSEEVEKYYKIKEND
jgi:hypothetical protein